MSGAILGARVGVRSRAVDKPHPTTALAGLMLKVLTSLVDFERAFIQSRGVGDAPRAVARGVKLASRSKPMLRMRQIKTRGKAG
jgi:hypothetical protein